MEILLLGCTIIIILLVNFWVARWVYRDAQQHAMREKFWGWITFISPSFIIIYLMVRSQKPPNSLY